MSQFRKILPVLSVLLLLFSPAEAALKIGDKAPDFTVSTTRGKAALGDFLARGPLVLAFYFADFTPTWTGELQAFQRDLPHFEKLSAQVLGVSPDSIDTHQRFILENGLDFPLAADENGALAALYGQGRVTFIIGSNGIIQFVMKGVPDNEELLKRLKMPEIGGE